MSRPTCDELAREADAWRALATAERDARLELRGAIDRLERARMRIAELGLCAFTPPAVDRLAAPEQQHQEVA